MKVLNFLASVGNQFLFALVALKAYLWFSPEVGFDLPNLTYLNVLAITWLISAFKNKALDSIYLLEVHNFTKPEEEGTSADFGAFLKVTVIYLCVWLYFYIVHSIFF